MREITFDINFACIVLLVAVGAFFHQILDAVLWAVFSAGILFACMNIEDDWSVSDWNIRYWVRGIYPIIFAGALFLTYFFASEYPRSLFLLDAAKLLSVMGAIAWIFCGFKVVIFCYRQLNAYRERRRREAFHQEYFRKLTEIEIFLGKEGDDFAFYIRRGKKVSVIPVQMARELGLKVENYR